LLKALSLQVEEEGKKEEDLYENFVCWGKSIISQKTASNKAAEAKIDELNTYIADLDAGRIELTSERADLEKEIATLMSDLEEAKALREKEHEDFLEAEKEMNQAIDALDEAIKTLDDATKDHHEGVLLAVRSRLKGAAANGGMAELAKHQESLRKAVEFGERFLAKADATFLKRILLGDVPKVDWKKLNRKATFKMAYKARSFKIQDTLKKLHQTFSINLQDAKDAEAKAQEEYETLKAAKEEQLDAARTALTKMAGENGAKQMSREDAVDEVKALTKQVEDDTKFIQQTEKSLAEKKESWKVRSQLREGELAAISKAIEILHNDDARDLFKRSFASQAPGEFLQVQQTSRKAGTSMRLSKKVSETLREAARRSGDARLFKLARLAEEPEAEVEKIEVESVKTRFGPIIKAIDKMIAQLQEEENVDLEIKEKCEKDRMENTREAILASREIDEMTDLITKLTEEIAECKKTIEELIAEHKKTEEALKKATRQREDEHAEFLKTDADDKAAAETVQSAMVVLENFYKENDLMFVQKKKQPVTGMAAGEAPPPPPATWEGGYGGKTGEATGIIAIMEMVHEDIVKDRKDAQADEDKSQEEYDAFKADSEEHMKQLMEEKEAQEKRMGEAEEEKVHTEELRGTKKGALNAVLETIEKINPNCEYFEVNFVLRTKNRHIEIDGLQKAKAILEGGEFDEGPDPNREIKPGDAFLQKRA